MGTKKTVTLADWWPTNQQKKNVLKVLNTGRLTYGPFTKELEEKFAKVHNFKYCIFTNSGTSALEIAWAYLKKKYNWSDGAEVIVPAVTFVATVNVLLQNRLKPVLVDVDPEMFNINPLLIEEAITKKTVAICPVNLLGYGCKIRQIRKIAKRYKLKIVEDSCETMFIHYGSPDQKPVGSLSDIACYSSYLAHIISTGVGGFLCTNSKKWADDMRSMIWHGRDNYYLSIDDNAKNKEKLLKSRFKFNRAGYSYRLTEFEAAIGVDEIDRSEEIIRQRQANAVELYELLRPYFNKVQPPRLMTQHAWMFFSLVCREGVDRDKLCLFLEEKGIQTRYVMPLTNQPVYKGMWNEVDYPVAEWVNNKGLLIGIHHFLTKKDLKYIAQCFQEYFND